MSATFPAVQLGFGFTLNGVGGILGIHRDVDVDALLANLRAGTLRSLISPEDPATEGAALARRAGEVFPVRQGTHVIGPTVKLGWGTPTLVSLDLALVVTLPDPLRIIVMGSVHAALPLPEAAVVELNLDIVGILDVSGKLLHIEGILRDSRVLTINLSGGFALRATWGETSSLAFSVGGLHPRALPPPGFPPLDRLSADLSVGNAVTVRLAGYLAVTSNTIQLGAQIDASFTGGGFYLSGGLGFDALVVFSPFSLEVDIRAWFEVRRGGSVLLEVRLEGSLRGPNAWEISGRASIKVLFFDVSVAVSETFGQRRELPASPVDAAERLRTALADPLCVAPDEAAPGARTPLVVLTDRAGLDPSAPLAVTQKVVPLDVRLDQLDGRPLVSGTGHTFGLAGARLLDGSGSGGSGAGQGQALALGAARTEQFAPGSIRDLDEAARLAAPAFEHMTAGAALDPAALAEIGTHLDADTGREVIVVDAPDAAPARTRRLRGPAAAGVRTGLSATRRTPAPAPGPLLVVEPEEWVAMNPANGRASGAGTWSQAQSQAGGRRSVLATADELAQIAVGA